MEQDIDPEINFFSNINSGYHRYIDEHLNRIPR